MTSTRRRPHASATAMALRRWAALVGSLSLASATFSGPVQASESASVDWVDWDALATGQVILRRDGDRGDDVALELAVLIDAEWSSVWQLLTDCESTPQYVPDVIDCRLLDE